MANHPDRPYTFQSARELREEYLKKFGRVDADRGLRMRRPRSEQKQRQYERFVLKIQSARRRVYVVMALSNDWETFLKEYGELLRLRSTALDYWRNKYTPDMRAKHAHRKRNLIAEGAMKRLEERVDNYITQLKGIFAETPAVTVYHTSVLERRYPDYDRDHLDILFAVLNSLLHVKLFQAEATNSRGEPIKFRFIRLTSQYHRDGGFMDFRPDELDKWDREMAYRQAHNGQRLDPTTSFTHRLYARINDQVELEW
ncbi:MAG: hypothetical protein VX869_06920 [Chloroflexota bacterium]|nr:hypothetical protein [Chloroflexota bacterium]